MRQCGVGDDIGIDLVVSDVNDEDAVDNAGWWRRFLRLDFLVGADDAEESDADEADSDGSDDGDDKDAELHDVNLRFEPVGV